MDASFWLNLAMAVIAVIACIFAGLSAKRAKEANALAAEANTLAVAANATAKDSRDISDEANRIAESANQISEGAQKRADEVRSGAIWDSVEMNLHWLLSFDHVRAKKPIDEVLVPTRFSLIKLAEHIGRSEVSDWLQSDWKATANNIAAVMETPVELDSRDVAGSVLRANESAHVWVAKLLNNIRRMRADGITPEEAKQLRARAEEKSEELRQRFGWESGPSLGDFEEPLEGK
ncbi:MAG: hypothetical protein ACTHZ5_10510 [Micrococcaceae bacterium]